MAATEITTTPADFTDDFDLTIRETTAGSATGVGAITLYKSPGSGTTNWAPAESFKVPGPYFVKNTGTNSYKINTHATGLTAVATQ